MTKLVKNSCGLFALALLWTCCAGFINPDFTPVDLVKQSDTILNLEITKVDKDGMATATVQKVIQGELKEKEIKIDFSAGVVKAGGDAVMAKINDGAKQAMLFVGQFPAGGAGGGGGAGGAVQPKAYLHVGGAWVEVEWDQKAGTWDMNKTDDLMLGTWYGATDMLLRAVNYVLTAKQANLPVRESFEFADPLKPAKLEGIIYAAVPVAVTDANKPDLFIAGEQGDHLFRWNGKTIDDVTAASGLSSKSQCFAWGNFNGDGLLDLASWDGKGLTIFVQGKDGKFTGKSINAGDAFKDGCLALTTLDSGNAANKGRPALLVSTKASPVILTIQDDGTAKAQPLVAGDFPGKNLGDAAECLVADFANTGMPDIVQLFAKGGLYYKGVKPGEFAAPTPLNVCVEPGKHAVCVGDWDGTGLLSIFTSSEQHNHLWRNTGVDGVSRFIDSVGQSGSVAYIAKPGGTFAQTINLNNDGRRGLLVLYVADFNPQLFFNRGFRSFGLCRRVDAQLTADELKAGQQAGCMGNFLGDGPPSMAVVQTNGELWFFPRKSDNKPLGINVSLSAASPNAGPVMVWLERDQQPFGVSVLSAGDPAVFYGVTEPGQVTVKWRFPGGEVQQKKVTVDPDAMNPTAEHPDGVPVSIIIDKVQAKAASNK